MIIDSHMHLPVDFTDLASKKRALLREMSKNRVDRGVVIADSELESVIGSVKDCAGLFSGDSVIKVVAGISPLISFEEQLRFCRELLENGDIIGLKVYTGHEHFYCTDSSLFPVYDLAAEFRVPVLFHTGWDEAQYAAPEKMRELAQSRRDNTFVYCHCFYPETDKCFEVLGGCGNVYFDTSSVADDSGRLTEVKVSLEKAIRLMPDRFIFGSDFGSCSQEAHLRLAESLDITDVQRELFMHRNSEYVYRL
ncbi:MAG: amidohydrolase family protein [Ruminococcus sp.]|uniref:amidohydrolase family protein n=1 Tax=Ruminococcus sp. TaxID=41978 RepID=UPI0025DF5F0C|nr:amidohydrolase family protein [Ruminococcus sp.]MBR5683363.1 amidohydrolase family protein [Ruminococcus sp.]